MIWPTLKLLPIIVYIFVSSCDDFTNLDDTSPPQEGPAANAPKCLSITGSRYEKFYYQLDPDSYNTTISLNSPSILGYEYRNDYAFNQISILDVPLQRFTDNASFTHQVSGTVAVSGKAGNLSTAYSMPFEKSASLSPYRDYNSIEPLNVLNSFTDTTGNLTLAYTGNYISVEKKEGFRTFSMTFSAEFLRSCVDTYKFVADGAEFTIDDIYPSDLTATGSAYVSLVPVKRNFYQYKNLTAVFSPGSVITDIKTTSIVKNYTYDDASNSIAIFFNDYDFPYIGDVLSFKIAVKENEAQSKVIRIEG